MKGKLRLESLELVQENVSDLVLVVGHWPLFDRSLEETDSRLDWGDLQARFAERRL